MGGCIGGGGWSWQLQGETLSGTDPDRDAESEEAILENMNLVPKKDITPSVDIITKGIDNNILDCCSVDHCALTICQP